MYNLVIVNDRERVLCPAAFRRLLRSGATMIVVETFSQKWQAEKELKRVLHKRKRDRDWQAWLAEDANVDAELVDIDQE